MTARKITFIGSLIAAVLSFCGCGKAPPPQDTAEEPTVTKELAVSGFDPDGEPVIRKWSDGSLSIHFEAMPPFFAEDEGTEAEFENFEATLQTALGVTVRREDREVFTIEKPEADTAEKAKNWLEHYRDGSR